MQIPAQISSRGMDLTEEQASLIRKAVADLDRFFNRMVSCRVTVSIPNKRPVDGPVTWTCRIGMTVPGGLLAVNRRARPSFRQALDDAFDAARRRLEDYSRELRGDTKHHADEPRGYVPESGFDRGMTGMPVRFVETEGENAPPAGTVVPHGHPAAALADLP